MDALMSRGLRPLVRRAATQRPANASGRRFCIIHLDGVSRETLLEAARRGYAPFIGRLIQSGSFRLSPCWSGAPASTPAFQAGLLYGARNSDIPGFMWFDRQAGREVRMDRSEDAARVEAGLANGHEGLLRDGSTSFSVFAGGAEANGLTMAGWAADHTRLLSVGLDAWHLAAGVVVHSYTAARILGRLLAEAGFALGDMFRQAALVGRFQHEWTFYKNRIGLAVGAREAATFGAALDIARGVPSLYVCFGDYDEIAHRRGPNSRAALLALWGIDRAVARIFAAAAAVPHMGYDFYVLSDHGQVQTRPFEDATGLSLGDYLALALPSQDGRPRVPEEAARHLSRMRNLERRAVAALPKTLASRVQAATLEAARALAQPGHETEALALLDQIVCIDAGDVAHVYLGKERRPLQLEEMQTRFGRILDVVTRCPAIGIVAARSARGPVAWIHGERIGLNEPAAVERLSAMGYRGRVAADFLAKMVDIPSAGDLVAYGNGLGGGDVAFAWEFGSHAGIAREEVETFVLHPSHVGFDFSSVQHGADLHDFFVTHYQQRELGDWGRLH